MTHYGQTVNPTCEYAISEVDEYVIYKIAFVDFKNSPKETQKKMLDQWGSKLKKEHLAEFMSIYNTDQHIKQNEVTHI